MEEVVNCTKGVLALNVVFCSILNCEQFLFFFRFSERVHVLARNEDGGQGKKETSRSLIPFLPENITFSLSVAWGGGSVHRLSPFLPQGKESATPL